MSTLPKIATMNSGAIRIGASDEARHLEEELKKARLRLQSAIRGGDAEEIKEQRANIADLEEQIKDAKKAGAMDEAKKLSEYTEAELRAKMADPNTGDASYKQYEAELKRRGK